ncbi:MAG: helicase-related protein [Candidatus Heimdallarchaeota archaeon]
MAEQIDLDRNAGNLELSDLTIERREYQIAATKEIIDNLSNSVLLNYPYGTGKTIIALLTFLALRKEYPSAQFVFTSAREAAALRCRQALEMAKEFGFVGKLGYLLDPKGGKGLSLTQRVKMFKASTVIFCPITTLMNERFQIKSRLNIDILSSVHLMVIDEATDVLARSVTGFRLSKHFDEMFRVRAKVNPFPILALTGSRDQTRIQAILRYIGDSSHLMQKMELSPYETITRIHQIVRNDYINSDQWISSAMAKPIANIQNILSPKLTRLEIIKMSYGGVLDRLQSSSGQFPIKIGNYEISDDKARQEAISAFILLFKLLHARLLLLESTPGEFLRYIKDGGNQEIFEDLIPLSSDIISHRAEFTPFDNPDDRKPRGLIHPKVERAIGIIYDHLTRGAKILLFSRYIALGEQLNALLQALKFPGVKFLSGKTPEETRRIIIDQFRKEDVDVLIFTPVGGRGLNLGEADVVVHLDVTSNLDDMTQRRERARGCMEYVLVLMQTSEEAKVLEYQKLTGASVDNTRMRS